MIRLLHISQIMVKLPPQLPLLQPHPRLAILCNRLRQDTAFLLVPDLNSPHFDDIHLPTGILLQILLLDIQKDMHIPLALLEHTLVTKGLQNRAARIYHQHPNHINP